MLKIQYRVCILLVVLASFGLTTGYSQAITFHFEKLLNLNEGEGDTPLLGEISGGVIGSDLSIYLIDNGNSTIQHFDKDGRFIQSIGREGRGPGEFSWIESISLDKENNRLHVFDYRNSRVVVFDSSSGEYIRTIILESVAGTPIHQIFSVENELFLLGHHRNEDSMIHYVDEGQIVSTTGNFIDFNSFVHSQMGRQQLSYLHASYLNDRILVGLAAPNRIKVYDLQWNVLHEHEDDLLPTPWETHMIMEPGRYQTTTYSMGYMNQLINDQHFLFVWREILDPRDYNARRQHIELRSVEDGKVIHSEDLKGKLVYDLYRVSEEEVYLLTRDQTYKYDLYKLTIDFN